MKQFGAQLSNQLHEQLQSQLEAHLVKYLWDQCQFDRRLGSQLYDLYFELLDQLFEDLK